MKLYAFPPVLIRLDVSDHERYGDGSWVYDEAEIARIPARELIAVEDAIGMSIPRMMLRLRQDFADGKLAASWVARRMAGITEDYATYEPLVTLMTLEPVGGDVDPPAPASGSSPSTGPPSGS